MMETLQENTETVICQEDETSAEGINAKLEEMREFLNSQTMEDSEYNEQLVRKLIEKVTVYEGRFEVGFKSGMAVDVKR